MIFNYNRIIPINELEIKNLDDEDTSDDTEENVSDDIGEVEDTDDDNDYTEDMPEDDETSSDDSDEAASDDGDEATDYTEESPDDADGESSSGGDADAGGTDYTEESPDDADGETEDNGGDESEDDGSQDDEEDPEQSLSDMEKNLFSNLTAPQMAIKNTELLQNYINLNKTLEDIFININNIPRTYNNARVIEFIANQTAELRDIISYVITDTYTTRTYVENLVEYKKSLLILSQINAILKGLIKDSNSNKDS